MSRGGLTGRNSFTLPQVGVGEIFIGIEPQDSAFTAFLTPDRSTQKKRKSNFAENRAPVRGGQAGGAVGIGPPLGGAGGPGTRATCGLVEGFVAGNGIS